MRGLISLAGGYTVREINVKTQPPPPLFFFFLLNGFLQRLFFGWLFYPQSCDCNVKPLTGKQRRTTPLRRQRMLRLQGTVRAACEPREDGPVPGKQTTATRQTPRIEAEKQVRLFFKLHTRPFVYWRRYVIRLLVCALALCNCHGGS